MARKYTKRRKPGRANHLIAAIKTRKLQLPKGYSMPVHHGRTDEFTTVREGVYRGKAIRVETTYKISIDGEPLTVHTRVLDDGTVHCHAFPNYSFPSAMDLARKIVDASSVEIPRNQLRKQNSQTHGGHH